MSFRKNFNDFKHELLEKHSNLLDVKPKDTWNGMHSKIEVKCPIHGWVETLPYTALASPKGCPKCGHATGKNIFIEKARAIHGDKYDYSKVDYKNSQTKVEIICPKHGSFWMIPNNHIKKTRPQGCPMCAKEQHKEKMLEVNKANKQIDTEEFIRRAKILHGDRYDYSRTVYKGNREKLIITCPEHGDFELVARNHLRGTGCPKCRVSRKELNHEAYKKYLEEFEEKNKKPKKEKNPFKGRFAAIDTEEFIKRAREVHGDKYDYSKVDYKNMYEKVTIICPVHGEFQQAPYAHLKGQGCFQCSRGRKITKDILEKALKISNPNLKLITDKDIYNTRDWVELECPIHDYKFKAQVTEILRYLTNCPICGGSKLERMTYDIIRNLGFKPIKEYRIASLPSRRYDFYIPEANLIIEVHGKQHYEEGDKIMFQGKKTDYEEITKIDKLKEIKAKEEGYEYLKLKYNIYRQTNAYDLIEKKIKEKLLSIAGYWLKKDDKIIPVKTKYHLEKLGYVKERLKPYTELVKELKDKGYEVLLPKLY